MSFPLPSLPYELNALEPYISAETVDYHYNKHTARYFNTASELARGTTFEGKDIVTLLVRDKLMRMDTTLAANLCQAWNHQFYWDGLTPPSNSKVSSRLDTVLTNEFGSVKGFKQLFETAGMDVMGSGWVWLVYKHGKLQIKVTSNANSAVTDSTVTPLFVCDVWEHAWYTQYPADKKAHLQALWNVVNLSTCLQLSHVDPLPINLDTSNLS